MSPTPEIVGSLHHSARQFHGPKNHPAVRRHRQFRAKVWRTNVWRTFEALDLSGNDQVAFYDDGVGTSSFKPLAILGGAFGFGLRRNVIALYKFACRNYRDADDELFGFGFSRGAFTIRIVMGLIDSQGLVKADNEAELAQPCERGLPRLSAGPLP